MRLVARIRRLPILIAVFAAPIFPAKADSWLPPQIETTYSANGLYRLVAVPREIGSQLEYFTAKADGKELPEDHQPTGRLETRTSGGWEIVWATWLVNEVAPVRALVSDDGERVVTFDNWHSTGFGDNVIVIYGPEGRLIRSLRLDQVIPAFFVEALPRSVSSIQWQATDPHIEGDKLQLAIADVERGLAKPALLVEIDLADGRVAPIPLEAFAAALPRFCAGHIGVVKSANEWRAFELADLAPLELRRKDEWPRYQYQVVRRLAGHEPALDEDPFELLPAGEYMAKDFRQIFREALQASASQLPIRWFSSRDLDAMTIEIERTSRKIKPNQLAGVEMHFLTDRMHWPRIEAALAKSGAKLVIADISQPIPQRAERVAELASERTIDPACKAYSE